MNNGVEGSEVWMHGFGKSLWKSGIAVGLGMDMDWNFILDASSGVLVDVSSAQQ